MKKLTISNIKSATDDELDLILEETEYTENGIAIGDEAAKDQDLRRAAQKEIDRRTGKENWQIAETAAKRSTANSSTDDGLIKGERK